MFCGWRSTSVRPPVRRSLFPRSSIFPPPRERGDRRRRFIDSASQVRRRYAAFFSCPVRKESTRLPQAWQISIRAFLSAFIARVTSWKCTFKLSKKKRSAAQKSSRPFYVTWFVPLFFTHLLLTLLPGSYIDFHGVMWSRKFSIRQNMEIYRHLWRYFVARIPLDT